MSFALPAVLALMAAAPPPERLAVVDVDSPPTMIGLASQVTQAVVKEAQAQKRKVMTPDDVRKVLGNKSYDELVRCGDRVACAANLAAVLGVDRIVTGVLGRDEKNYLLKLWLTDVTKTALVADVDRAVLIASRRFQRDVAEAVPAFLRGQREAKGTLVITATIRNSAVTVNGDAVGVAPVTVTLKPGRYEVHVSKKAYLSVTRLVDVEANQSRTEEVRMLLIPGQTPEEEKVPDLARAPISTEVVRPGFAPRWPTFLAAGLTVATLGVAVGFSAASQSGEQTLLEGYNPTTDTYTGTRRLALDAQADATVANVMWVAGGCLGALTIVSLILDATHKPEAASFTPVVTPNGAGVLLRGEF